MSSNNHQASFRRLSHITAELVRRNPDLDWVNSKALQIFASANYLSPSSETFHAHQAISFENFASWKTEEILNELVCHVNSMIISLLKTGNSLDIAHELSSLLYKLKEN